VPGPRITSVHVVVPVRDEELLLGRCLESVRRAEARLREERPGVTTCLTVVLDRCVDGSEAVAAQYPSVRVLSLDAGCVGAARAHGVADVIARCNPADRTWVANTDADTVVPEHWLVAQLALAESGIDAVAGTVEPDADDVDVVVLEKWRVRHDLGEDHAHVHGANLGFSLAAYVAAGGFLPLPVHEDLRLVASLRATGATVCAMSRITVTTSGRRRGRAPRGFAAYLRLLDPVGIAGAPDHDDPGEGYAARPAP
jgi:glycosyltransferase involved in cell wall biosynthesis